MSESNKALLIILVMIACVFCWLPLTMSPDRASPKTDDNYVAQIQREKIEAANGKPVLVNTWKVGDGKYPEIHRRYCYQREDKKMDCYITVQEGGQ